MYQSYEEFAKQYPMLTKWDRCCKFYGVQEILHFLEWLTTTSEYRIHPTVDYIDIVYSFFGIDRQALEQERRVLLDEGRRLVEEEEIDG